MEIKRNNVTECEIAKECEKATFERKGKINTRKAVTRLNVSPDHQLHSASLAEHDQLSAIVGIVHCVYEWRR